MGLTLRKVIPGLTADDVVFYVIRVTGNLSIEVIRLTVRAWNVININRNILQTKT